MNEFLHLKIVIPCYKETDVIKTLFSLLDCQTPQHSVDVIIVINHSTDSEAEVKQLSQKTLNALCDFSEKYNSKKIVFLPLLYELKEQSVGLARKIGMDFAYNLFEQKLNTKSGIIIALDADCTVAKNYLIEIEKHFLLHKQSPGASLYFEHLLSDNQHIIDYELHLRYLVNALRWTRHPYSFHTVGSAMAVRADAYKKQGGMNTRKAGEDFYFLQKMMDLGNFTDILTTIVYPSDRISDRVPFGTGRAMQQLVVSKKWMSYNFKSYQDIKNLVEFVPYLYQNQRFESHSIALRLFLESIYFEDKCVEIKKNTSTYQAFKKRFFSIF